MNTQVKHEQFLENRKKGIGGSDVAAILGFSPYKSPYQLWLDKTGRSEKKAQNESAHFGHLLEDVVAKEFSRRAGLKVQRVTQQLFLEDHPWAIGNIDRAVINPEISGNVRFKDGALTTDQLLECKTASEYMSKLFGEEGSDQVPDYYLTQCLWYLMITGCQIIHLAVLIGGNKFRMYRIERDEDLIQSIFEQVKSFWFNHVIADVPPDPTCFDDVLHRWSKHVVGKQVEANFEQIKLGEELVTVQNRQKADKAREDEIKLKIVSTMQDAEMMISQGKTLFTYKEQSSTRIDSTLLKKEEPKLFEKYCKTSSTRVFRISTKFKETI
ncbi:MULTISPECIES: YqaJ viral recombinase family protein [Acinetobacter]|uniref:YqaJ viral recombinase family nuclease n=1 Tax=Acinetobacter TaxID=469 RepID=UPI000F66B708|nr:MULTISPECIES: YqaJ viral recombinase family protein [Acinetobacter]MDA3500757.1 YqaJ viral recombinase family protein [Acinetobacter sp. AOR34_HL]RSE36961.1 recombinase [Acinetobacter junii]